MGVGRMITINIDKAKAIALKLAAQIDDKAKRSAHETAIGEATTTADLGAVVDQIKADTQSVTME
jgi:hypothetical protein